MELSKLDKDPTFLIWSFTTTHNVLTFLMWNISYGSFNHKINMKHKNATWPQLKEPIQLNKMITRFTAIILIHTILSSSSKLVKIIGFIICLSHGMKNESVNLRHITMLFSFVIIWCLILKTKLNFIDKLKDHIELYHKLRD